MSLHFLQPGWLALLAALPFIAWWRRRRRGAGNWRRLVDAALLPHLIEPAAAAASRLGLWLAALLWLLATLALAGPSWQQDRVALQRPEAARVIALLLDASMRASDLKPDRLTRARHKIDDILERSADLQTALIAYSGDAFVVAPLTDDHATVANLVGALEPDIMPLGGNEAAAAIDHALALVRQAGLSRGELILVTDSINAAGLAAAGQAARHGLQVSVLGVGTRSGAPVPLPDGGFLQDDAGNIRIVRRDDTALRAAARAGGGRYAVLSADDGDLRILLSDIGRAAGAAGVGAGDLTRTSLRWIDRGPWLVLLLLPLSLLAARRGWLMTVMLLVLPVPAPAQAAGLQDLWQRPDQQAASALRRGDAEGALAAGAPLPWQAAAAYRLQDYAAAARLWQQQDTAVSNYNRGNALAHLGQWQDALAAWQHALQQNPNLADAQANYDMLSAWLEERPPEDEAAPAEPQQGGDDTVQGGADDDAGTGAAADLADGQDGAQQQPAQQSGEPAGPDASSNGATQASGEPDDGDADMPHADANVSGSAELQEQSDKAMADQMDAALQSRAGQQEGAAEPDVHLPGDAVDDETRQAHEQWLQRIPDDPGGLLRRKFQLEYQQRQQARRSGR